MPGRKHLSGVSEKENRMYEHIKDSESKQGRSERRAKQIAAATVRKHHKEHGHSKGE
jgi:hypothetical protein